MNWIIYKDSEQTIQDYTVYDGKMIYSRLFTLHVLHILSEINWNIVISSVTIKDIIPVGSSLHIIINGCMKSNCTIEQLNAAVNLTKNILIECFIYC